MTVSRPTGVWCGVSCDRQDTSNSERTADEMLSVRRSCLLSLKLNTEQGMYLWLAYQSVMQARRFFLLIIMSRPCA